MKNKKEKGQEKHKSNLLVGQVFTEAKKNEDAQQKRKEENIQIKDDAVRILLVHPGHGISTLDVFLGCGDALKTLGHEVYPYELKDRLRFYKEAVAHFQKGDPNEVPLSDIYSIACQGLITSVAHMWPDLIIYITGQYIPAWVPALIGERFKGIKQAVWYTESPYMVALEIQRAPLYNYVFTCDKVCEPIYRRYNPNSHYLPTGYNSSYDWEVELKRWEKIIYTPDLFFVGSEVPGRLDFLKELASYITGKVDFKLFGAFPTIEGDGCPELEPFYIPITLSKHEVLRYYSGAKIVLNHFRVNESMRIVRNVMTGESKTEEIEPYSLSPRIYEILAGGGFLLTDRRAEMEELFPGGSATFKDAKDCADKIFYYLEHEDERAKIARKGKERINQHTYINRVKRMLEIAEMG